MCWRLMLCSVWDIYTVMDLSSCKLCSSLFLAKTSWPFCILALGRACALRKHTSYTCTLLMLCHRKRRRVGPNRCGGPFSPAPLLQSPSTQAIHASVCCCLDAPVLCPCHFTRSEACRCRTVLCRHSLS